MTEAELSDFFNARIELVLKPEWGSEHTDYQKKIREHLDLRLGDQKESFHFSISHTEGLGGYALVNLDPRQMLQIGFDLEKKARVSTAVAERICVDDQEFKKAPGASELWCAKEAAFKSLKGEHQPLVISDVVIRFLSRESHSETFEFDLRQNPKRLKTKGLTWTDHFYQMALACFWT